MSNYRKPLKSLGQNFLVDANIIEKIVRSADLSPTDCVLEIGPGRGALTHLMSDKVARLVLVEYDHALAATLQERYAFDEKVTVVDGDILAVRIPELLDAEKSWKVVANLPYNISTEVLFRLLEIRHLFSRLVLMLQKEVGERLVALPDSADYGVTTLLLGLWFDIRREFIVPPGCFNPRPKVDSAILSFVPLKSPRIDVGNEECYRRLVKAAFAMRRKTLNNCLKASGLMSDCNMEEVLHQCGVDGKRRGETLSMNEFAIMSRHLSALQKQAL